MRMLLRALLIGVGLLLVFALGAERTAQAQPWCANFTDGSQNCGIPTLQACEQTVSGVGGGCAPDPNSQPQRSDGWPAPQPGPWGVPPGQNDPNSLNFMPRPPGQ
jgi:hypothetical protein